jgi:hypothetical protein
MRGDFVRLVAAISLLFVLASSSGRDLVQRGSQSVAQWVWERMERNLPESPFLKKEEVRPGTRSSSRRADKR